MTGRGPTGTGKIYGNGHEIYLRESFDLCDKCG